MLKKVFFDGVVLIDLQKENQFELEYEVRKAIDDHGCSIKLVSMLIKKESDIPESWKNCIPYGDRKDDKTCIDIYNEELVPKISEGDPNQMKFGFWEETKKKRNGETNGKAV